MVWAEVTAAQAERAKKAVEQVGESLVGEKEVAEIEEERLQEEMDQIPEGEYEGYTADQIAFMKTHYATIRPSPTLLRTETRTASEIKPFVRSKTDDLGEHVLCPTHDDEVSMAKRRQSFRLSSRFRQHRIQKSHTH
jgi:hypothetical protein